MLNFQTARIGGHQLKDLASEQQPLIREFEKSRSVEVAVHAIQGMVLEKVLAASRIRKRPADVSQRTAERRRNESVIPLPVFDHVFVVSGKEFIAAVSRQRNLHTLCCEFR